MQCYLQHFGGFHTRGTSMRDRQTCSPLSCAISCARLRACSSVVDSNCAPLHFHLGTFQPNNLPPKRAPTNSSSQLNTTNSFCNTCTDSTHAAINKTCNFCSNLCYVIPTTHMTNVLEEPSGSTIHLPGMGSLIPQALPLTMTGIPSMMHKYCGRWTCYLDNFATFCSTIVKCFQYLLLIAFGLFMLMDLL